MEGKLFSENFLLDGVRDTPVWQGLTDTSLATFFSDLKQIYRPLTAESVLNEANTEAEIIEPILALLGWRDLTLKQVTASSARREDVPDFLLFPNGAAKGAARAEAREDRRYRHGIAILEAKRWMRPLDRGDLTSRLDPGTPSNQILRYLSSAEIASERKVRWGVLTNGAVWRLYWQGARSRSEEFLDINLAELLGVSETVQDMFGMDSAHGIKLFLVLFQRAAFLPQAWDNEGRTFHEYAFNEARLYEEKVSFDLGERVFTTIFPQLADALAAGDPQADITSAAYLTELRDATLILLYRLLFVLYAEDRSLLPVRDERYDDYALRKIREDIAQRQDRNDVFSGSARRYWHHLGELFRIISQGDSTIGLPAYNGGLFEESRSSLLTRTGVPDARFAPLFDALARRSDLLRAWINYRDLSVQHLGGIYERLLEYSLVVENGCIVARPASFARKVSGSYYTHDGLVKLIIREAVGPLVKERKDPLTAQLKKWKKKAQIEKTDWQALDILDPASVILELKICDPAMGSGHFLVSLVDYLADEILEAIAAAELDIASQPWAKEASNPWASPLVKRIQDIRNRILSAARQQRWAVTEAQLDDRHLVRRMILKRVIFGVDKNPMAVELAKVALWLHTFTVGAPLSFLDHHLHCGDSLFGGKVRHIAEELNKLKGGLLQQGDLHQVESARLVMDTIGNLTDIDIAEAHRSKALMDQITDALHPMRRTLDFFQAQRWAGKAEAKDYQQTWVGLLAQEYGDNLLESVDFLAKRKGKLPTERERHAHATMQRAMQRAEQEHFLHWELAFPTVWQSGQGGFDAIIGNPPWDRMKLQEVEWFSERKPEIAKAARGSDRKKLIAQLEANNDPLWQDYLVAQKNAEIASMVARTYGDYPLLSGGDTNLYALFVERASSLVKSKGIVGLLTPIGIATGKGAEKFFRALTTFEPSNDSEVGTRLAILYDFENKYFFPDVDSRDKFCIIVFGGVSRRFKQIRSAFFIRHTHELDDPARLVQLSPEDFFLVNPNTGGAPIFRSQHDADITTAIYRRQPVLVDRRDDPPKKVWPLRYCRMFDMTNDSHLFKRRDELEKEGWYPVGANRWKKGDAEAIPLYVGRMTYNYDHRSSHVTTNEENLHNAALSTNLTAVEKVMPDRYPTPQYWVSESDVPENERRQWAIGFRDIARATDMRTMIAAVIPTVATGNTLPLLLPNNGNESTYEQWAPLLLANLNALAFDYVVRQKAQSTHLNWYIVEQLPLIRPEQFEQTLGKTNIADYVRGEVLYLSYTAHDLAPFARDLGYDGAPFAWDENDRRHRLARLDALFFYLYGLSRDDAAYILDTFPIVRQHDENTHGRYLTKELILAYMNAVGASDFTTVVQA